MLHAAPVAALDPVTLYRILRLRVDVFVVEQRCAYPELDGRDVEPGAVLHWATDDAGGVDEVVGTLRVLTDPAGEARIGRVATRPAARGAGVAAALVGAALASVPGRDVVLDAQSTLAAWYARFGFEVSGPEFVEDGIAHLPMRRPA